jgi:hypothetical protein
MVMDRILHDSLEKHRQLARRLVRVLLGQLEHCVLDDIDRAVLVADSEHRLLERPTLDFSQECRNFLIGGQSGVRPVDTKSL